MNFETMSKQRKMILIAAAVGIISMFLPWWSFIITVNGMQTTWGVIVFLCFVAAGVVAFMGDQTKNLNQTNWMVALIAGGLAALVMVINFLSNLDLLSLLSFGFYGALIASVAMVAATYLFRSATDNLQTGFDSLKSNLNSKMNSGQTTNTTTDTTTTPTTTTISHTPTNDPTRPTV
jgi:peptidoglycan/LPS O-acetylase OafA/YrhL